MLEPLLDRHEDHVLDPVRVSRGVAKVRRLRREAVRPERRLDLAERTRHRQPEEKRDEAEETDVVDEQTDPARDAMPAEPVDPRTHGGGDDDPEEDEGKDELELP